MKKNSCKLFKKERKGILYIMNFSKNSKQFIHRVIFLRKKIFRNVFDCFGRQLASIALGFELVLVPDHEPIKSLKSRHARFVQSCQNGFIELISQNVPLVQALNERMNYKIK